jgi:two-component system chemotaxis response regulator CheY
MLKEVGFEVQEASNGREGLDRLHQQGCADLVMVDWNMPGMNGWEFVRAVRAERAFDGVPLVMVTTETEAGHIVSALESGANEYIMKPFTKDVVLEKLALLGITLE